MASTLADSAVTNAKLSTTTGEPGGAWTSWTPTAATGSFGTGAAVTGAYQKIGKTIRFRGQITFGTGFAAGSRIALPFPLNSGYASNHPIAQMIYGDFGTANYNGTGLTNISDSSLQPVIFVNATNGRADGTSGTNPFTWAVGDIVRFSGEYEAA